MFKPKYIFMLGIAASLGLMTVWQRHEALKIGYEIARLEAEKIDLQEKLTLTEARLAAMESPPMAMARVAALRIRLGPPDPTCAVFSRPGYEARPGSPDTAGAQARRDAPAANSRRKDAGDIAERVPAGGTSNPIGGDRDGSETAAARLGL